MAFLFLFKLDGKDFTSGKEAILYMSGTRLSGS